MLFNFFLEERHGFLHSTRFCCFVGLLLSITLMPVSISRSTTPNPYTSLFTYNSPVQIFIQFKHMLVCGGSKHWTPLFLTTFLTSFPQIHSLLYITTIILRSVPFKETFSVFSSLDYFHKTMSLKSRSQVSFK